jgi:hydroxymethylpyrimidine kinase/phosphomethylpyrimidine kinase
MTKICLTIAGVDPSGGAGIIADIKTFTAFGCYTTAVISSITFQNTQGVFGAVNQTAQSIRSQFEPILDDFEIAALKTGMLPTREVIEETARLIKKNNLVNFVVDPVVRSTSGFDLIDDKALRTLINHLFPLSKIVTPNIPEAERISKIEIKNADDIRKAARIMQDLGAENVLIKGGHLSGSGFGVQASELGEGKKKATDYLFIGGELQKFESDYIETTSTHGTGCTLAAAITANLALGKGLSESVKKAKDFVTEGIRTSPNIGKGNSPINSIDPFEN